MAKTQLWLPGSELKWNDARTPLSLTRSGSTAYLDFGGVYSASSVTRSGSTVTVQTSAAHNLVAGKLFILQGANETDYNGLWAVLAVNNSTEFTFTIPTTPASPATGTISLYAGYSFPITSIVRSGDQVTATTYGVHGYVAGMKITIAGSAQTEYNGTFTILSAPATNTFQYQITSGTPTTPGTGTPYCTVGHDACTASAPTGSLTISGAVQSEYNGTFAVTYDSLNRVHFTVSGTPASPATGTIVATNSRLGLPQDLSYVPLRAGKMHVGGPLANDSALNTTCSLMVSLSFNTAPTAGLTVEGTVLYSLTGSEQFYETIGLKGPDFVLAALNQLGQFAMVPGLTVMPYRMRILLKSNLNQDCYPYVRIFPHNLQSSP